MEKIVGWTQTYAARQDGKVVMDGQIREYRILRKVR